MTDITFEWFADHVAQRSRQVLTTMGKPVGLTPYRRHGQWRFRNAAGDDVTLEDVFRALQQDARSRKWLLDAYEWPIRRAEEDRQAAHEREQQLIADISGTFDFLTTDFGYSPPFRIPVRLDDRAVLAYRHPAAARQVEVSGDSYGYRTHCEIRRLIDGEPGAYGPHSVANFELRMVREHRKKYDEPFNRREALRDTAQLLRRHSDVLLGTAWVDRKDIDRAMERDWLRPLGIRASEPVAPSGLDLAKQLARFLVETHGFVLEFDSSALSPHETEMSRRLVYRRGTTTVEICNPEILVPHQWCVELSGEVVAQISDDFAVGLTEALNEVARRIS